MTIPSSSQNPKSLVVTALITAVTTILVSLIAIFPQLRTEARNRTQEQIDQNPQVLALQKEVEELRKKAPPPEEQWAVSGTVGQAQGLQQPLKAVDIYLVPSWGKGKDLVTQTEDTGKFSLKVPQGQYSIVLLDPTKKWSYRSLIPDPTNQISAENLTVLGKADAEIKASGAYIKYHIAKTND